MTITRLMLGAVLALMMSVSVQAASPDDIVRDTTKSLLASMAADKAQINADPNHIYRLVERVVLPHVDVNAMSRWVMGKHWRRAKAEQRDQFVEQFQVLLLRTYGTALANYEGQNIRFEPAPLSSRDDRQKVKIIIEQAGGTSLPITFSLYRNKQDAWKVYDLKIDGISLVANYRSNFATQIRRGGVAGLLDHLVNHNNKVLSASL